VAPDGSRAGLIWSVGEFPIEQSLPPEPGRWGVWVVPFPKPIRDVGDLVECFRHVLSELRRLHAGVVGLAGDAEPRAPADPADLDR
jgi:hypothetical protein